MLHGILENKTLSMASYFEILPFVIICYKWNYLKTYQRLLFSCQLYRELSLSRLSTYLVYIYLPTSFSSVSFCTTDHTELYPKIYILFNDFILFFFIFVNLINMRMYWKDRRSVAKVLCSFFMATVFSSPEKIEHSNLAMGPGRFLIQGMKKVDA